MSAVTDNPAISMERYGKKGAWMAILFAFALTLLVAVLISDLAARSALSTSVLFLAAGYAVGRGGFDLLHVDPHMPIVAEVARFALLATLFSEGLRTGVRELASSWRLPGRALLVGLPLALLGTALLAHWLAGLTWLQAFLLGAVLTPTDPVFATAIVRQEDLSQGLRQLLNIESGLNDGLALPVVLVCLGRLTGAGTGDLVLPIVGGVALGVAVPFVTDRLERSRFFGAEVSYRPLAAFAVALVIVALAELTGANEFLAAFAGGVTVISLRPEISSAFRGFAESLADLLKFAGLFVFGALLSPNLVANIGVGDVVFCVLALVLVRPVALSIALVGSGLPARDWVVAAWFGPKGFASVLYAVMAIAAGVPGTWHLFQLASLVVALSIVAHSSTDVVMAQWLRRHQPARGHARKAGR